MLVSITFNIRISLRLSTFLKRFLLQKFIAFDKSMHRSSLKFTFNLNLFSNQNHFATTRRNIDPEFRTAFRTTKIGTNHIKFGLFYIRCLFFVAIIDVVVCKVTKSSPDLVLDNLRIIRTRSDYIQSSWNLLSKTLNLFIFVFTFLYDTSYGSSHNI